MEKKSVLGIDIGSREVKIVAMRGEDILIKEKMSTMAFYKNHCHYKEKLRFSPDHFLGFMPDSCVSTGYGRMNIDLEGFEAIVEIKAHVHGAMFQSAQKDFVLLDIGGQDVKVISVKAGQVVDLKLNDKCAASCGRYLENMAKLLEISLEDLSRHYENPVALSSTCAVFSESELIGKIAQGVSMERLCSGVNYSMFKRMEPLLQGFDQELLLVSGGVALSQGVMAHIRPLFRQTEILPDPQFNGALGACSYAFKKLRAL